MKTYCFVDLETTGVHDDAEITQFAAAAVRDGQVIDAIEIKLWFDKSKANPEALAIQGYTDERWAEALEPEIALGEIIRFLNKHKSVQMISKKTGKPYYVAQLVGYNAAVFDAPKLRKLFERFGKFYPCSFKVLDVMQLVLWFYDVHPELLPENIKLGTVAKALGVEVNGSAHDALVDVYLTIGIKNKIYEGVDSVAVAQAVAV